MKEFFDLVKRRLSKKTAFVKAALFAAALSLSLFSCSNASEEFNEPVRDYFDRMTNTSAVLSYALSCRTNLDAAGNICVPSDSDITVTFYLRNPKEFKFNSSNMGYKFQSLEIPADTSGITLAQDASNVGVITMNIPSAFLVQADTGYDISPSITLYHPVSHADFGTFTPAVLKANSVPPVIYGAVVYRDPSSSHYVVCFNMPSTGLLMGVHRDITGISVTSSGASTASYTSDVTVETNGRFTLMGQGFNVGEPLPAFKAGGSAFFASGQPVYLTTNDSFSDEETEYTLVLTDSAGLSSTVTTSTNSIRLDPVTMTNVKGQVIHSGDRVEQDEGSSYATVTFTPALVAQDGSDTSDSVIVYEVYQGEDDTGKSLYNGKNDGGPLTLKIPSGEIYVRIYSHKDLYADSFPMEFGIQVLRTTIYVSSDGSDTEGTGSKGTPFATIAHAVDKFDDMTVENKLFLLTDISGGVDFDYSGGNVTIFGDGHTINGAFTVKDGNFGFDSAVVSGDILLEGGNLSLTDASVAGTVDYKAGSLSLGGRVDGGYIVLAKDKVITISKTLTGTVPITVKISEENAPTAISPYSFTSGYGDANSGELPQIYFDCDEYAVNWNASETEAAVCKSGGSIGIDSGILDVSIDSLKISDGSLSLKAADSNGNDVTSSCSWEWEVSVQGNAIKTGATSVVDCEAEWISNEYARQISYELLVTVTYNGRKQTAAYRLLTE